MEARAAPIISHSAVKAEGVSTTISKPDITEADVVSPRTANIDDVDENHFLSALTGGGGSEDSIIHDLSCDLSPERVIRRIGQRASEILAIERCSVFFVDSEANELVVFRNTSTGVFDCCLCVHAYARPHMSASACLREI